MSRIILCFTLSLVALFYSLAYCKVFMTREEALKHVFPDADNILKRNIFLNKEQVEEIESIAKTKLHSKLYVFYEGKKGNETLGYAVIDTHHLRTKTETVITVINPDGTHKLTGILAFFEPSEYMPSKSWLKLYQNKPLDDSLWLGRTIPNITGATITSNALMKSIRSILAVYQVAVKGKGSE
jgi:Na+-translocating ferredoxin:NAD+ oxidoreductase subunit G